MTCNAAPCSHVPSLSLSLCLAQITAIEPLVSYGGASANTQHLHQSLRWFFGVVAVVTDVGHVLLVDLCLDDFSCTQTELEASGEIGVTTTPRVFGTQAPRACGVTGRRTLIKTSATLYFYVYI